MASGVINQLIYKKSYVFNTDTDLVEKCFPLDLPTSSTVIVGIRVTDRVGWNFIARNGVRGDLYSSVWALTTLADTLSGTFHIEVYYLKL